MFDPDAMETMLNRNNNSSLGISETDAKENSVKISLCPIDEYGM